MHLSDQNLSCPIFVGDRNGGKHIYSHQSVGSDSRRRRRLDCHVGGLQENVDQIFGPAVALYSPSFVVLNLVAINGGIHRLIGSPTRDQWVLGWIDAGRQRARARL
jgi:hypothetical protein